MRKLAVSLAVLAFAAPALAQVGPSGNTGTPAADNTVHVLLCNRAGTVCAEAGGTANPVPVAVVSGGGGGGGSGGAVTAADGALVTEGSKADTAGATGSQSMVSILKQLHLDLLAATPDTANTDFAKTDTATTNTATYIGAPGSAAAGSDTGTFSLNQLTQRMLQSLATGNGSAATSATQSTATAIATGTQADAPYTGTGNGSAIGVSKGVYANTAAEAASLTAPTGQPVRTAGTTGVDYSANKPALPNVGASPFGGTTSMSAWVLLATIPASATRASTRISADGGQRCAIITDDGTAASGAAPANATLQILDPGSGLYTQGGSASTDTDKGRKQVYCPSGAFVSARVN